MLPNVLYNVQIKIYESKYCSNVEKSLAKNWTNQICAGKFYFYFEL